MFALAAAILVAAASFSLLSAAGKTTEIRVRGSVESNYRTAYDILVRPKDSAALLERDVGLVRNNYLSGLFGGITLEQWRRIKGIQGVDAAAPVANIGLVIPYAFRSLEVSGLLNADPVQLYRIRRATVAHRGTSRYPQGTDYIYYTQRNRFLAGRESGVLESVGGESVKVCSGVAETAGSGPFQAWQFRDCYSARSPGLGSDAGASGRIRVSAGISFPILIAAIDPSEEARLLRLDRTIVSGRYLRAGETPRLQRLPRGSNASGALYHRLVPVMASATTYVDEYVDVRIERLSIPRGTNVPKTLASKRGSGFLRGLQGREIARRTITPQAIYEDALAGVFGSTGPKNISRSYWTASPTSYGRLGPLRLAPNVVTNPLSVWRSGAFPGGGVTYQRIPLANADLQFRRLRPRIGSVYANQHEVPGAQVLDTPVMLIVGRYDPDKLPGFSPLSRVPLETYYPPELLPADDSSERALKGKPLLPSQNIGDYVAQPPLFLTTLEGMRPFLNPRYYAGAKPGRPISVIRVRVEGVSGPDEVSQARVRAVATEIHERTGLRVDITAGSSPKRLLVELQAGKFGRPELLLEEGWSKKGVSVSFLDALDRKRLGLLSLILVSCLFFLGNSTFASVRGRRSEIGTLLCLGWPRRAIFAVVVAELILVGALAGLLGAAIAFGIAHALSLDISLPRVLLVAPLALGLALLAGIVPAWRASQSAPLDAVRPAVTVGRIRGRVRGLASLALQNVRRMPARSLVGAGGLFIGVAAMTLLLAVNQTFQGRLVGTLLGEAITLDVRGLDFLIVALIVTLATLSLADVLYLNLRERSAELMTLHTVGWSERQLGGVIAMEALALGLLGSAPGALLGLLIGAQLGVGAAPLAFGALAGIVGGVLIALLASLLPLLQLRSLRPSAVLAEE